MRPAWCPSRVTFLCIGVPGANVYLSSKRDALQCPCRVAASQALAVACLTIELVTTARRRSAGWRMAPWNLQEPGI